MKRIIAGIAGLLCLAFFIPASAQSHQPLIIDNAKILTPEQYKELNFILNGYYNAQTVEFVFFSTKSLGGKPIETYAKQIVSNFGIGTQGINSGLLFFIALEEQKVRLEIGHGLEWQITDVQKKRILDMAKGNLRDGNFFEAARIAFIESYELIKNVPWSVGYESFKELGYSLKTSMNNIISFQGSAVTKNLLHSRTAPNQFGDRYFINVQGDNGKTARLYYSINMIPLVERILNSPQTKIYARVTRTGPVRLDLLGID